MRDMIKDAGSGRKLLALIMTAVFLAWMSVSLTGCAGGENGDKESDFPEEISKTAMVTFLPVDSGKEKTVARGGSEPGAFVESLDIGSWKMAEVPEDLAATGTFVLYQQETVKLGQSEEDAEMIELCRMAIYDGPYVTVEIWDMKFSFRIDHETMGYLKGLK